MASNIKNNSRKVRDTHPQKLKMLYNTTATNIKTIPGSDKGIL